MNANTRNGVNAASPSRLVAVTAHAGMRFAGIRYRGGERVEMPASDAEARVRAGSATLVTKESHA